MQARTTALDQAWQWKERDHSISSVIDEVNGEGWTRASSFPSEIHVELIKADRIPDPFIGFNEHDVQWVGEREWLYYTTFELDAESSRRDYFELSFEGLDTVCDVYLNGVRILATDNMFCEYSVAVSKSSLKESSNSLLLHFKSTKLVAKELEARYGRVRAGSTNLGDPSRVYLRKAQYCWRWDWGPELMTCGPYRPIKLLAYNTRIATVHAHATVSPSPELAASLKVDIALAGDVSAVRMLRICVLDGERVVESRVDHLEAPLREPRMTLDVLVNCETSSQGPVRLWWPVGYGEQPLYDVVVEILSAAQKSEMLDRQTQKIGFRRVELVQEPLQEPDRHGKGTTFLFEVNGVRMFMGGSNWIPAHSFLTKLRKDDYRAWLTLLRDGNQNMVRLWGGGVYEPDCFYDICDELGILVWQDFQFACGVYPAHKEFVENVRKEAEGAVTRLRHHPSLALFCGNNEDYQQVLQWGDVADLPARVLYEDVLPGIVAALCDVPYHRGSPYGGEGWDTSDPTVGDIHQWDIWAGKERPWQGYAFRNGRFVSEFGVPSFPNIKTVDYWLNGDVEERWAQSRLMAQHNRAGNHERRFAIVMNENFRLTGDPETHIYNTQIMQSEAVSLAYRMWRREWRGRGKEYTAGALIWQLNDCWPVTSWSIVDFFRRAKPAYYTIARELRPITVGIIRTVTQNRDNDRPKQFYEFGAFRSVGATIEVWGTNRTLEARAVRLELRCFDLRSPWTHTQSIDAVLHPNQSTELLAIPCPCPPLPEGEGTAARVTTSHSVVVGARLIARESGDVLARYADWPQPFRHVDFPDPALRVDIDWGTITVSVERPVKGLFFTLDGGDGSGAYKEAVWSDNALDVLPGDPQTVEVRGLEGQWEQVRAAYMGCERGRKV